MERKIPVSHQEKLFKILLALGENRHCADCRSYNPDWVSTTLGVFICFKCSGTHRSFGLHITRVKSTTLDSWTLRQIYIMACLDNRLCNAYWEANIPDDYKRPTFDSAPNSIVAFARKKYVERAFTPSNKESPAEKLRNDPKVTAEPEEDEDRGDFFKKKEQELKQILKEKVNLMSPDTKRRAKKEQTSSRSSKKAGTVLINGLNPKFGRMQNQSSSPVNTNINALVSPLGPSVLNRKQSGNNQGKLLITRASQSAVPSSRFPLFKGLNVKTTNVIDEALEFDLDDSKPAAPKMFMRSNTLQIRATDFSDNLSPDPTPDYENSKNSNQHLKSKQGLFNHLEENIFEESRSPTPLASIEGIEMCDMSNVSSVHEDNNPLLILKKTKEPKKNNEVDILSSLSSIKSQPSDNKHSVNAGLGEGEYEPHLKRPSEAFIMPKCLSFQELPASKLKSGDTCWKICVMVSCTLVHFTLGYMYSWGGISPYIASFIMDEYDDQRYIENTSLNMMIFLGISMGYCLCEKFANSFGMRIPVLFSLFGLGAGLFFCSLATDIMLYSGLLTIIPGFFIGTLYEIPFFCATQYFWSHPIFLRGFFYICNGIGAFGYMYFSYFYLNVRNSNRELDYPSQQKAEFYTDDTTDNVPILLYNISLAVFLVGVVASILLRARATHIIRDFSGYRDREESLLVDSRRSSTQGRGKRKAPTAQQQGLKEALASVSTKKLLSIILTFSILGSYFLYSYKCLGMIKGHSDMEMTVVGGIGVLILNIGKTIGVVVHPKYEFKTVCKSLIIMQAIMGGSVFLLEQMGDYVFLALFFMIMLLDGFLLSLVIEEIKFVNPDDIEDSMVALVILAYAVANFLSFMIVQSLVVLRIKTAIALVLSIPLFIAYNLSKGYSREKKGEDSEMISILLAV